MEYGVVLAIVPILGLLGGGLLAKSSFVMRRAPLAPRRKLQLALGGYFFTVAVVAHLIFLLTGEHALGWVGGAMQAAGQVMVSATLYRTFAAYAYKDLANVWLASAVVVAISSTVFIVVSVTSDAGAGIIIHPALDAGEAVVLAFGALISLFVVLYAAGRTRNTISGSADEEHAI